MEESSPDEKATNIAKLIMRIKTQLMPQPKMLTSRSKSGIVAAMSNRSPERMRNSKINSDADEVISKNRERISLLKQKYNTCMTARK